MASEVKLSSKGQIVVPKEARKKLGLRKGDRLKVEIDEKTKSIIFRASVEAPRDIFVRAGTKTTSSLLKESDSMDEKKIKRLLNSIGVSSEH